MKIIEDVDKRGLPDFGSLYMFIYVALLNHFLMKLSNILLNLHDQ